MEKLWFDPFLTLSVWFAPVLWLEHVRDRSQIVSASDLARAIN
jgi:hypothetical protein